MKWNMTKEKAVVEFKNVCAEMREANEKEASMTVCVALGKRCGELMGILEHDFGMTPKEIAELNEKE